VGGTLLRGEGGNFARRVAGTRIVVHQRRPDRRAPGVAAQQGGRGAIDGNGINPIERQGPGKPVEDPAKRCPPDLCVLFEPAVDLPGRGQGCGSLGLDARRPVDEAGATARGADIDTEIVSFHRELNSPQRRKECKAI
jgi:hypothetical protein